MIFFGSSSRKKWTKDHINILPEETLIVSRQTRSPQFASKVSPLQAKAQSSAVTNGAGLYLARCAVVLYVEAKTAHLAIRISKALI